MLLVLDHHVHLNCVQFIPNNEKTIKQNVEKQSAGRRTDNSPLYVNGSMLGVENKLSEKPYSCLKFACAQPLLKSSAQLRWHRSQMLLFVFAAVVAGCCAGQIAQSSFFAVASFWRFHCSHIKKVKFRLVWCCVVLLSQISILGWVAKELIFGILIRQPRN